MGLTERIFGQIAKKETFDKKVAMQYNYSIGKIPFT